MKKAALASVVISLLAGRPSILTDGAENHSSTTSSCPANFGVHCLGDGPGCCSPSSPCLFGDGPCEQDQDCGGTLVCGGRCHQRFCDGVADQSDCPFGEEDDCCDYRKCGGADDCCAPDAPCEEGDGHCETDGECVRGLVCGFKNCEGEGFDENDNCCRSPCTGANSCCSSSSPCHEGEGYCDSDSECAGDLRCGSSNCPEEPTFHQTDDCCMKRPPCLGGGSCCSAPDPCPAGEGDCDGDDECREGLKCGHNNCGRDGLEGGEFDSKDDCCYLPEQQEHVPCTGGGSCCSPSNLCLAGEGDCDRDADCAVGLRCGDNNCPSDDEGSTFDSNDDCCYEP